MARRVVAQTEWHPGELYPRVGFLRTLAMPAPINNWSLPSLQEKLIKIGAKVVSHGRYVACRGVEVAVPRMLFAEIPRLIAELRPTPGPAGA
jgi:hypothetical protein